MRSKNIKFERISAFLIAVVFILSMMPLSFATEITLDGTGTEGDPYLIGTEEQLIAFRNAVADDTAVPSTLHAKLTANIQLTNDWSGIGTSAKKYSGVFDGAGYRISNMTAANASIQGFVAEAGAGLVIKNLTVEGTYNKTGQTSTAGFVGKASGAVEFINCINKVNITGTQKLGGFIGAGSYAHEFTNCANYGDITGTGAYVSGFMAEGTSGSTVFVNCANYGNIEGNFSNEFITGISKLGQFTNCIGYGSVRNTAASGYVTATFNKNGVSVKTNCYYRSGAASSGNGITALNGGTSKSADVFESGEVAYLLNGSSSENITWGQQLGVDSYPIYGKTAYPVYSISGSYSNTPAPDYSSMLEGSGTESDPYLIGSEEQLIAFKEVVANDAATPSILCAKLTSNIQLTSDWAGIGTSAKKYSGVFDGAGYRISNMTAANDSIQGFVAEAGAGLVIKNLTVEGTYNKTGQTSTGGFVGKANGAVEFINCINKVNITGTQKLGGFIGSSGSYAHEFTNCANYGDITGTGVYVSGFMAEGAISDVIFTNCANYGNIEGNFPGDFIAGISKLGQFTNCVGYGSVKNTAASGYVSATFNNNAVTSANKVNCYYRSGAASTGNGITAVNGGTSTTESRFASGEITYLLNGSSSENVIWGQRIRYDNYPVLGKTGYPVYMVNNKYSNSPEIVEGNISINVDSDGYVTVEGELAQEKAGDPITLIVTNNDIDILDESVWLSMNGDEIVYYKADTLWVDKTYVFRFKLEELGIYNAYLVSKNGGSTKTKLVYVDDEEQSNLISDMLDFDITESGDLESLLEGTDNLKNLGVFEFGAQDINEEMVEILLNELVSKATLQPEEATLLIEKSILASKINEDSLESFYDYPNMSFLEDNIFDYCTEEIADEVVAAMSAQEISSISDFDESIIKSTALVFANKTDEAYALQQVLEAYKTELGITKTITGDMCVSMCKAPAFSNYEALAYAINNYKKTSDLGGSNSSPNNNKNTANIGNMGGMLPIGGNSASTVKPDEFLPFDDIANVMWAKDAILRLYKENVINGKGENQFCPMDNVTRAEFVKILMLAFDVNLIDDDFPFTDVSEDDWSYQYIKTAYLAGVVNGVDEVTFGKNMNITREDLCTIVYRLMKTGKQELETLKFECSFEDVGNISEYAKEAAGFMQKNAIINGDENGNFNPKSPATRAEAAKIVYNAMNLYEGN